MGKAWTRTLYMLMLNNILITSTMYLNRVSYPNTELSVTQINMLVIELKSEALKDRHWKQLMKRLHVNWVLSELTLGQIWDVDLQQNDMVVRDVLLVAQGEMVLKQVTTTFNSTKMYCSLQCNCNNKKGSYL